MGMADLDADYWNANDRIFDEKTSLDLRNVGISHGIGDVGEGLKTDIFLGASSVELGFFGTGKGSRSSPTGHTPESYSKDEREQMREMAKINEVELSTHAAPDLGWLSGFNRRDGFDDAVAEQSMHEVKRAIDFAADVAEGGPVVFHLSEFPRPIAGIEEGMPEGLKPKGYFEAYEGEAGKAITYLVDEKTGKIIQSVKEDEIIYRPKAKPLDSGEKYFDTKGRPIKYKPLIGEDGKPVCDPVSGNPIYDYDLDEKGDIQVEGIEYKKYKEEKLKEGLTKREIPLEFHREQLEAQRQNQLGHADEYEIAYKDAIETRGKILETLKAYEELWSKIPEDKKYKFRETIGNRHGYAYLPPDQITDPVNYLKEKLRETEKRLSYGREIAISSRQQAKEIGDRIKRAELIDDYAIKKSTNNIAEAAMYAYEIEKKRGLEKPLWLAPENWSPENYGSSPEELKHMVIKSREAMAQKLLAKKKASSQKEADRIAEEHIKATFDVGHMNFWKKYYKGDDEDFKKWYVNNVKELVKSGIIGHVHMHDNFGYHDEHLRSGEGNAPIKEFIEELEKEGFKGKIISEPGGQKQGQYHTAWTSAIGLSKSPIYKIGSSARSWTDIQGSYFGRTGSPSYVVGEYAPSRDWTLWTEVPLE